MKKVTDASVYLKSKVTVAAAGCWEWNGFRDKDGYGVCGSREVDARAHRAAWEAWRGDIPEGRLVCHTCDNTCCINPEHLFLGTHKQNMDDKHNKGRHRYATRDELPTTKSKTEQVDFIKKHYKPKTKGEHSGKALAERFGCSLAAICHAFKSDGATNDTT